MNTKTQTDEQKKQGTLVESVNYEQRVRNLQ